MIGYTKAGVHTSDPLHKALLTVVEVLRNKGYKATQLIECSYDTLVSQWLHQVQSIKPMSYNTTRNITHTKCKAHTYIQYNT